MLNQVSLEKIFIGEENINIGDYDEYDEDQSSSGKYYSIKSNNNFSVESSNKSRGIWIEKS